MDKAFLEIMDDVEFNKGISCEFYLDDQLESNVMNVVLDNGYTVRIRHLLNVLGESSKIFDFALIGKKKRHIDYISGVMKETIIEHIQLVSKLRYGKHDIIREICDIERRKTIGVYRSYCGEYIKVEIKFKNGYCVELDNNTPDLGKCNIYVNDSPFSVYSVNASCYLDAGINIKNVDFEKMKAIANEISESEAESEE